VSSPSLPDGRRFLIVRNPPGLPSLGWSGGYATELLVLQNWFAELRRSPGQAAP
jgi:hypothetical protein